MCGIVGAFAVGSTKTKVEERMQQESMIFIATQLLQLTVSRGEDATGIAMLFNDGNYAGLKMGIPSPDFISKMGDTENDYGGQVKLWREYGKPLRIFMGHCRKASVGNSYDNKNNHPVKIDDTFIVHNGTLTNHEKIFENLECEKDADVDSEAVARLVHKFANNGLEPFSVDMINEVVRRIHGTYAVIAASGNNPYQVAMFRDTRPIELVLVRPLKTVFVASEKDFLERILFEYAKMGRLFLPASKLPHITKADLDFETMQDDSLMVGDLTVEVTEKTMVKDIFAWKKGPWRTEKIWGANSTTTVTTKVYGNTAVGVGGADAEKKALGPATSPAHPVTSSDVSTGTASADTKDDEEGQVDGFIWSRSMNTFKTEKGILESKKLPAVEIDVEMGKVTPADGGKSQAPEVLKETDQKGVENLVTSTAITTEEDITPISPKKGNMNVNVAGFVPPSCKKPLVSEVKKVDLNKNIEATVAAELFASDMSKYETEEEVLDTLDLSDVSVFRALPLHAITNRIAKVIAKTAFYLGFVAGSESEKGKGAVTPLSVKVAYTAADKLEKAEKKIRILKVITRIMDFLAGAQLKEQVNEAVEEITKGNTRAIKSEEISEVFTVGDMKKLMNITKIHSVLEAQGKKKD